LADSNFISGAGNARFVWIPKLASRSMRFATSPHFGRLYLVFTAENELGPENNGYRHHVAFLGRQTARDVGRAPIRVNERFLRAPHTQPSSLPSIRRETPANGDVVVLLARCPELGERIPLGMLEFLRCARRRRVRRRRSPQMSGSEMARRRVRAWVSNSATTRA
jgi:hypothetical protein